MTADRFDRITIDPEQMNGQPCIRGMRLTVRRVLEALALYPDRNELFAEYPELEEEDVRQALAFTVGNMSDSLQNAVAQVLDGYRDAVAAAYLFGSTVNGDVAALSDVDVAVLFSEGALTAGPDLRFHLHANLCRVLRRNDIDLLVLNTATNLIIKDEIVRNGRLVFEGDSDQREAFELSVIHSCIDFKRQRKMAVGY